VFVDIDPKTFALDPELVAASVSERTRAIMPVHCFGYACDTARLGAIAERNQLRLVYDAAHAFGIDDAGGSILRHGDASVLSFHATKIFTTFEGGAVVSSSEDEKLTLDRLRNFGLYGEAALDIGINAKLDEFRAAVGLLQLRTVASSIEARGARDAYYRELLAEVPGIRPIPWPAGQTRNFYSFPVLVEPEFPLSRDALWQRMHRLGVVARRYFFPLVSDMVVYRERFADIEIPVARDVSSRILCLPLYPGLSFDEQARVVDAMRNI
jgi:dTDP-4-amino-4,6-dideoxygalactose transaminase